MPMPPPPDFVDDDTDFDDGDDLPNEYPGKTPPPQAGLPNPTPGREPTPKVMQPQAPSRECTVQAFQFRWKTAFSRLWMEQYWEKGKRSRQRGKLDNQGNEPVRSFASSYRGLRKASVKRTGYFLGHAALERQARRVDVPFR